MNRNTIGFPALCAALVVALLMMVMNLLFTPGINAASSFGLCLPSPNLWGLSPAWSWALNSLLLCAAPPLFALLNKRFNFVQGNGMAAPILFALLCASNFFISRDFCSSTLLAGVNIICLGVIFDSSSQRNATQDYFLIATLLAIGVMIQYAFLAFIPAYFLCGIVMRSLRLKEGAAFLLGLLAPYWVALGLGLISPADFNIPKLASLFSDLTSQTELFLIILQIGLLFIFAAMLCLNNAMLLYAGNSQIRRMNNCINILGFTCAICMMLDFNNLFAYAATLYLWVGVQIGNLFALHRLHRPQLILLIICGCIIAAYVWTISTY